MRAIIDDNQSTRPSPRLRVALADAHDMTTAPAARRYRRGHCYKGGGEGQKFRHDFFQSAMRADFCVHVMTFRQLPETATNAATFAHRRDHT
jgi:hypothetical protein